MKQHLLVTGVRHRTAPIEVRERFAFQDTEIKQAIETLKAIPGIDECAILTTCNRTEFYITTPHTETGLAAIRQFLATHKGLDVKQYRPHTFTLINEDAILHLFRVASGLDSLILGEGQILGQVKDALNSAQKSNSTGLLIDKVFKTALTVGKRVRTETGIAEKDVSVSRAAYEQVRQMDTDLFNKQIALIGGGKMAEILITSFKRDMTPEQLNNIRIVNRSERRLETLTEKHGLTAISWDKLDTVLSNADILFVATGAPHVIFGEKHFEGQGDKLIVDIAVPRNVDARVCKLPNITLINTDNLSGIGGFSPETQTLLKEQAEAIIYEEYSHLHQWRISLPVIPTISKLHAKLEHWGQDEASRTLVKKILHEPLTRLRNTPSVDEMTRQADVINHLFDLDQDTDPVSL